MERRTEVICSAGSEKSSSLCSHVDVFVLTPQGRTGKSSADRCVVPCLSALFLCLILRFHVFGVAVARNLHHKRESCHWTKQLAADAKISSVTHGVTDIPSQ